MKKLTDGGVDVLPQLKSEEDYEFDVDRVFYNINGEEAQPLIRKRLAEMLAQKDAHLAQLQARNEELNALILQGRTLSAEYRSVVKEVCRSNHAGMSLDELPQDIRLLIKRLGEKELVDEYAEELRGNKAKKPDKVLDGIDDGTTSSSFGATRAKVSLAAAQETLRQGLKYKGCDIRLLKPGLAEITVKMNATPGQLLDCQAMQQALQRHLGPGDRIRVKADVHTSIDIHG
jgi:hypothetical protein